MNTSIVNITKEKYDVYIGRGSKWGNPFTSKNSKYDIIKTSSRKESIKLYEEWLVNGDGKYLLNDLHELKGKVLGCFCKPKSCHGDVLVKLVNDLENTIL